MAYLYGGGMAYLFFFVGMTYLFCVCMTCLFSIWAWHVIRRQGFQTRLLSDRHAMPRFYGQFMPLFYQYVMPRLYRHVMPLLFFVDMSFLFYFIPGMFMPCFFSIGITCLSRFGIAHLFSVAMRPSLILF